MTSKIGGAMTEQDSPEIGLNDDVQIIREILFGDSMKALLDRIAKLESKLAAVQRENRKLRKSLATEAETRQQQVEAEILNMREFKEQLSAHFGNIEKQIGARLKDETTTVKGTLSEQQRKVEQQIARLEKRVAGELETQRSQWDELVKSLVSVLTGFQTLGTQQDIKDVE